MNYDHPLVPAFEIFLDRIEFGDTELYGSALKSIKEILSDTGNQAILLTTGNSYVRENAKKFLSYIEDGLI